MDYNYENLIDDNLVNECDQIRSIAKKSWLSSAGVSLAHLDSVKAKVYNLGPADPKDLKATNLREKKNRVINDLPTNPPLSELSLQKTAVISGSNTSIPDLIRQHSYDRLPKPTRPASASVRRTRPLSGHRQRPQSAKEPIHSSTDDVEQPFGVKGAKYDPSGRPPKGIPTNTATGWVGPPAGLKYPDRPPSGQGWKLEFPKEANHIGGEAPPSTPVPTSSSPEPLEQEERTKKVFELFIGDPYSIEDTQDEEVYDDSDNESGSRSPGEPASRPVLLRKPVPESLRLSLPAADDDESDQEMDTERLLHEAEMVTKKLDLQAVFKLNKVSEPVNSAGDEASSSAVSANQNTKLVDDSASEKKVTSHSITSSSQKTVPSASSDSDRELFVHLSAPVSENNHHSEILNDIKIEEDVSTLIGNENILLDNVTSDRSLNNSEQDNSFESNNDINTEDHNKRKGIIHEHREKHSEHEKAFVKFSEKNVTVDITPRNLGRKVTELTSSKKTKHQNDSFIDLIEVKSRIEPVLQAGKAYMSPRKVQPPNRPPSGKLRTTQSSQAQKKPSLAGKQNNNNNIGTDTSAACSRIQSNRPKSAPINRAVSPVTIVTVDYGEETSEKPKPGTDENSSKMESKPKKKRAKSKEEVVTMMQKIGLTEGGLLEELENDLKGQKEKAVKDDDSRITSDNFAKFNSNTGVLTATVCKSVGEKNYYEIARHSSMSNKENNKEEDTSHVYKTTKTIEFDELVKSVKSVIDPALLSAKEKEKFLQSAVDNREATRGRPLSRPSSANVTKKPPVSKEGRSGSQERPGSRMGFVAMAPDKSPPPQRKETKKTWHRPSSAPVSRQNITQRHQKDAKLSSTKSECTDGQNVLTDKEKQEREKVIDNLLERTKTLLGEPEDATPDTEKKNVRPASAYVAIARSKDQRRVRSAGVRRPCSAKTSRHRHTVSSKTPRKSSGRKRTVLTEPCIINTNTSFDEDETEEGLLCQEMEKDLAQKGVNVKAETLQRALYPPTGRTKYYRLIADLPRSNSLTLLSHPKVWLPEEYKRLQKAEKTLSRANEIMYLQHRAELRRAKLAELGPEEQKKKKKKGKKGGKKLRRSNSFG